GEPPGASLSVRWLTVVHRVRHQILALKDRCQQAHVVQVQASEVTIVAQDAVTWPQPIASVHLDGARDEMDERPEVHRLREGLRDHAGGDADLRSSYIAPRPWFARVAVVIR